MKCPNCSIGKIAYEELKPKSNYSYAQYTRRRSKLKCDSCDYEEVFS